MQHPVRLFPQNRSARAAAAVVLLAAALGTAGGCDPAGPADPPAAGVRKPYAGVRLTVSCPDAAFATAVAPMANTWAARTGAAVALVPAPMTAADATDVGVVAVGELGRWGEGGLLTPVPLALRTNDQYQWQGLLPTYAERLSEWGGQTLAVPLTGDGHLLVYRADRFAEKAAAAEFRAVYNRPLDPPATWEEFADLAEHFARLDKRPSLPPLPADPDRLFDLVCRVAAAADRRALNDAELAARTARDRDALSFQFSVVTGKPRLRTEDGGFRFAAAWLDRLRAAKAVPAPAAGAADDPVAALADGRAVLAVVSLDQLARLPRDGGAVAARFALASVPGTRHYPDPGRPKGGSPQLNYIPYFSGGRLGVVRTRCPHPDAAFDLLAELGGPTRGAEFIATPGLGAGPTRGAHLDRDRLVLWLGYGFDADRSKRLQDALRQYVGLAVKNPAFGLRGPDRDALVAAAADPLRKIVAAAEAPTDALKQVEDAWNALDAKVPPDVLLRWRQRGAGLN
jgi:ABC-type glycerol-3-phosphate transport system substrate-binding protein